MYPARHGRLDFAHASPHRSFTYEVLNKCYSLLFWLAPGAHGIGVLYPAGYGGYRVCICVTGVEGCCSCDEGGVGDVGLCVLAGGCARDRVLAVFDYQKC